MAKQDIEFMERFDQFCDALSSGGALLVSLNDQGVPNAMTIGWAMLGIVWRRPICAVFVRPSRYTYGCIEAAGDFTVCVPGEDLSEEVLFCGTKSGRKYDKFQECGFTATSSRHVKSPGIDECRIIYECTVVQKNDVVPEHFIPDINDTLYSGGDYHRVYYGEVLASYGE
jgi:flavin reductase (DIM6/NTAB) family NADH-FMN oxidoreductase RutF